MMDASMIARANELAAEGLAKRYFEELRDAKNRVKQLEAELAELRRVPADVEISRGRRFRLIEVRA